MLLGIFHIKRDTTAPAPPRAVREARLTATETFAALRTER
jgi:hypothetical protein